ncbi:MAG: hypothetical protein HN584_06190 [Akkermansiaceae bacterium]|nr:hypothetical protein [Akkermansiaceae bacterium]
MSDDRLSTYSESANGWFVPDVPIDVLYFEHRNRAPSIDSSAHIYLAENVDPPLLQIQRTEGLQLSFKATDDFSYSIQESDDLIQWREVEGSVTALDLNYLFSESQNKKALVPKSDIGNDWIQLEYDDSAWLDVESVSEDGTLIRGGIGFANPGRPQADSFDPFIALDLEEQMYRTNTSAYLRIPFMVENLDALNSLILSARTDDGFVAWLNGELVQSFKAPEVVNWDSEASATNSDSIAQRMVEYPLDGHMDKLKVGKNVLAVQALNKGINNSDFLFSCQLGGLRKDGLVIRNYPGDTKKQFYRIQRR